MNAANVMAISPKAGAVNKVQSTRMVSKVSKASAGMSKGSFDEALGKAGEEVTGKMAKSPTEAQGSIQGNVDAKEADIKDDMPEGTDAALNSQQGKEPKSGKTAKEWKQTSQGAKVRNGENDTAGEQDPDTLNTQAVALNFTAEGKAVLTADEQSSLPETAGLAEALYPQTQISAGVNLQSLLPQAGEDVQKNKNFLAMLSGQQVKLNAENAEGTSAGMMFGEQAVTKPVQQPEAGQGAWQLMKPATMLEVQLNNHRLANRDLNPEGIQQVPVQNEAGADVPSVNQAIFRNVTNQIVPENGQVVYAQAGGRMTVENMPQESAPVQDNLQFVILNNGRERQDAKGMAPFGQSEEMMPSMPVGKVNDSGILQEAGRVTIPAEMMSSVPAGNLHDSVIPQEAGRVTIPEETMSSMPAGKVHDSVIPQEAGRAIITEEPIPSMPAGKVNDAVLLQETGHAIIPEQMTSPAGKKETAPLNNSLAGVSITVEDVVPVTEPAMDMQDNLQQDLYRQNQQAFPETKVVTTAEGEMVSRLVEEAVGDKSPMQPESDPSVNPESAAMFRQSLNDSLTGSKMTNETNQTQNLQEDFNVPRQIVEQARLLRRGEDTQMVIKLHPDHLGELTLKVSVSANGAVNASFHSDNAQVRAIIENTLVQLKQELNNQGLKVDNVDVYAGLTDGQLPQGEGQQAWQQNQGHSSNGSMRNLGDMADYGEETENIAAGAQGTAETADGVDYRV